MSAVTSTHLPASPSPSSYCSSTLFVQPLSKTAAAAASLTFAPNPAPPSSEHQRNDGDNDSSQPPQPPPSSPAADPMHQRTGFIVVGPTQSAKTSVVFQMISNVLRGGGGGDDNAHDDPLHPSSSSRTSHVLVLCDAAHLSHSPVKPFDSVDSLRPAELRRLEFADVTSFSDARGVLSTIGTMLDHHHHHPHDAASSHSPPPPSSASSFSSQPHDHEQGGEEHHDGRTVAAGTASSDSLREQEHSEETLLQQQQSLAAVVEPTLIVVDSDGFRDCRDVAEAAKTLAVLENTILFLRRRHSAASRLVPTTTALPLRPFFVFVSGHFSQSQWTSFPYIVTPSASIVALQYVAAASSFSSGSVSTTLGQSVSEPQQQQQQNIVGPRSTVGGGAGGGVVRVRAPELGYTETTEMLACVSEEDHNTNDPGRLRGGGAPRPSWVMDSAPHPSSSSSSVLRIIAYRPNAHRSIIPSSWNHGSSELGGSSSSQVEWTAMAWKTAEGLRLIH